MEGFIEIIKAWPIIVQGALGSALFWLLMIIGQKLASFSAAYMSKRSKQKRISWLVTRTCKHDAFSNLDNAAASYAVSVLIYRSLQSAYKAFLWLGFGFVIDGVFDFGLFIGALGFVYYLLKAFDVVSPFKENENTQEENDKVINELKELGTLPSESEIKEKH
jgi:hypothetical protein